MSYEWDFDDLRKKHDELKEEFNILRQGMFCLFSRLGLLKEYENYLEDILRNENE